MSRTVAFGIQVGIGKDRVKPLLDTPDHRISQNTCEKLRVFTSDFIEGVHYVRQADSDGCEIRLARDHDSRKNLTPHEIQGIERLYQALLDNPQFTALRPALDSLEDFQEWLRPWGNASEDLPSEQFFVYRVYQDTVISFLYGERHLRTAKKPLELFALWYLVGTTNAFYEGSPVGLDAEAKKNLPVRERESALKLTVRLLEELRAERSTDYIFFEVDAQELQEPDSLGRLRFRVYARAEEEVRHHFAYDPVLRNCQFFVLDFAFWVPRWNEDEQTFRLREHRLACCPLRASLLSPFKSGTLSRPLAEKLISAIYEMYWDYYDDDSEKRRAIGHATDEAIKLFHTSMISAQDKVPCLMLREYVQTKFR